MVRISIEEAQAQGLCEVVSNDGWIESTHPAVPGAVLTCYHPGAAITIRCPREVEALWLLKHGWSGAVAISTADHDDRHTLSRETEDLRYFAKVPAAHDDRLVTLTSLSVPDRKPDQCEVWLLGFSLSALPRSRSRSMLLNTRARFIRGDWGDFIVLSGDNEIPNALVRDGAWAPGDIDIFRQYIAEGDAVIDVGANFGHHTVVFSKLVGPAGRVMAIEAQAPIFQLTNANAVVNGCRNIIPLHVAAGADRGTVTMYPVDYEGDANFGALGINTRAIVGRPHNGEEVESWPVDELARRHLPDRTISFVKIDVQAFELFVLQGMTELLARDRPTVFTEISPAWMAKAGYDYREIYNLLRSFGYEFTHTLADLELVDGIPQVAHGTDIEWDLLAVHPSRA